MDSQREEKWIKHYSSHHKILLVGEGDFSFALCLAKTFGSASKMVATSLDSKGIYNLLGEKAGLSLVEEVPFWTRDYPGYVNMRGSGSRRGESFPARDSSTFKFCKSDVEPPIEEVSECGNF